MSGKIPAGPELFPGPKQGSVISHEAVRNALREAARRWKLHKRVTPHVLRHRFATHLLELGTDIGAIQTLLGYRSIRTTVRYVRVSQAHVGRTRSPVEVLDTQEAIEEALAARAAEPAPAEEPPSPTRTSARATPPRSSPTRSRGICEGTAGRARNEEIACSSP
ncbi:tyrosine-type recombinase/integrase [Sorangium cellulosum]|nr:tyrosine-type recombinase/integrase [Sorangium cellulosum]